MIKNVFRCTYKMAEAGLLTARGIVHATLLIQRVVRSQIIIAAIYTLLNV
jgi:hypothetical protein